MEKSIIKSVLIWLVHFIQSLLKLYNSMDQNVMLFTDTFL